MKSDEWSVQLYSCETWTISKNIEKNLKSLELRFFRRMQSVSWLDKKSNGIVFEMAAAQRI